MAQRTMAKVKEVDQLYISVSGLQKYLGGVGTRRTQQKWRNDRLIPFYIVAGKVLYRMTDVNKFMANHRISPAGTTKLERN